MQVHSKNYFVKNQIVNTHSDGAIGYWCGDIFYRQRRYIPIRCMHYREYIIVVDYSRITNGEGVESI